MTQTRFVEVIGKMGAVNLKKEEDTHQIVVQVGKVYIVLTENDDVYISIVDTCIQIELADIRYFTLVDRKDGRKQVSVGFGLLTDRYSFAYFTV